ncbi:tripartite motif-containing protein 2-like [Branchiostoma floridae]|uniref:Tripartite motif-containing protein 2-like n=1 Tax=Branchiostoma floridae TaxID=7739 RepID=A0A9J7MFU8_BRAFL|nr:tripartite motif-containing protein 2-like [Branchiostoma floridae]
MSLRNSHDVPGVEDLELYHKGVKLRDATPCPTHKDQVVTAYCNTCEALLCLRCTQFDHRPGPDHDPCELTKIAERHRSSLRELMNNVRDLTSETVRASDKVKSEQDALRLEKERAEEDIKDLFDELTALLEEKKTDLLHEVRRVSADKMATLTQQSRELDDFLANMESEVKFCEQALSHTSDAELVPLQKQIQRNLTQILSRKVGFNPPTNTLIVYRADKTCLQTLQDLEVGYIQSAPCSPSNSTLSIQEVTEGFLTTIQLQPRDEHDQKCHIDNENIEVEIKEPSGSIQEANIETNSDGTWDVKWKPRVSGEHCVVACINGYPIRDSPYVTNVKSNNPVLQFGKKGTRIGRFKEPIGIAIDKSGQVVVADSTNARIQIFDPLGKFLRAFPTLSSHATGVGVSPLGDVVVVEWEQNTVMIFSAEGKLLQRFRCEHFRQPYGVAVRQDGWIVVADAKAHRVFVLAPDGTLVRTVGERGTGDGQFEQPYFVATNQNDDIIVAEMSNHRVQVFDFFGNFKRKFGSYGHKLGQFSCPAGVAVDRDGQIIVVDTDNHRVQVFRDDGKVLSVISSAERRLNIPHGVAATDDGHVFVADTYNHCVKKYRYM